MSLNESEYDILKGYLQRDLMYMFDFSETVLKFVCNLPEKNKLAEYEKLIHKKRCLENELLKKLLIPRERFNGSFGQYLKNYKKIINQPIVLEYITKYGDLDVEELVASYIEVSGRTANKQVQDNILKRKLQHNDVRKCNEDEKAPERSIKRRPMLNVDLLQNKIEGLKI